NGTLPPGYGDSSTHNRLKLKARASGTETTLVDTNYALGPGFLTPDGVLYMLSGHMGAYGGAVAAILLHAGAQTTLGFHGASANLRSSGHFAAFGWGSGGGFFPGVQSFDLRGDEQLYSGVLLAER